MSKIKLTPKSKFPQFLYVTKGSDGEGSDYFCSYQDAEEIPGDEVDHIVAVYEFSTTKRVKRQTELV